MGEFSIDEGEEFTHVGFSRCFADNNSHLLIKSILLKH